MVLVFSLRRRAAAGEGPLFEVLTGCALGFRACLVLLNKGGFYTVLLTRISGVLTVRSHGRVLSLGFVL